MLHDRKHTFIKRNKPGTVMARGLQDHTFFFNPIALTFIRNWQVVDIPSFSDPKFIEFSFRCKRLLTA